MLPSFAQAFASDNMSTTLPPIRKRNVISNDEDNNHLNNKKRRRLTHSPHPHPPTLRIDLDNPAKQQSTSTPISPVGFTVQRDLVDHVRSVKQIRKKQEALIEQRRGSAPGPPDDNALPPKSHPLSLQQSASSSSSPNQKSRIQTIIPPSSADAPSSSRLPPPPISFANRAIGAGKKKPADLHLVSPRESSSHHPSFHPGNSRHPSLYPSSSQPVIQSAPPSQIAFSIPMALPRLPANLMSSSTTIPIPGGGKVPPTPTRLSMQSNSTSAATNITNGKSPPASIPIASTLVPNTPTTLLMNRVSNLGNSLLARTHPPSVVSSSQHQPHPHAASAGTPSTPSSGAPSTSAAAAAQAKQAFLAPFELFYDAVHDARQLKDWFNEQLTRTAVLMRRWEEQQNQQQQQQQCSAGAGTRTRGGQTKEDSLVKREEVEVEAEAEGPVEGGGELGIREEIERLRRRVEELEGRLGARDGASPSVFVNGSNGGGTLGTASSSSSSSSSHEGANNEGYTFPPSGPGEGGIGVHQQQPREYPYEQQRQEKGELEQRHDYQQPSGSKSNPSLALPPGLSISDDPLVRGRPELGRRLSSPEWHPSSSRSAISGTSYRVVGRVGGGGGDGPLDREKDRLGREIRLDKEGGHVAVGVSKSLSGPGAPGSPGNGSQFSNGLESSSRRGRGRRVSISGEFVPSFGLNAREPGPAVVRRSMRAEEREGREERRMRERDKRADEAGGMDVDAGSISGGDGDRAREGGAREPVRERKIDKGKEHENDRNREEGRR